MSPAGMDTMTAEAATAPATEPGIYRFRASLGMTGGWALKLMLKVQGEPETVVGTIVFNAR
jgi:hypothetical protein